MTDSTITPERREALRDLTEYRYCVTLRVTDVRDLLNIADERDALSVALRRVQELVEWHETKAMKARRFRPEINGENRFMDKAAEIHDDAARRIVKALHEEGDD